MKKQEVNELSRREKRLITPSISVMCVENPFEDICLCEELVDSSSKKVIHFKNDVSLLFDQQRINRLSQMDFDKIVANLKLKGESRFAGLSDSQIIETVKSRYFQSTTDIAKYQKYLENEIDSIVEDAKREKSWKEWFKKNKKSDKSIDVEPE